MQHPSSPPSNRVIRMRELRETLGISRSSIYLKLAPRSRYFDPAFPTPIKLGMSSIGWRHSDVQAWLELQAARAANSSPRVK
ncbi:helix-turn-helix transcriptional regulator [Acidovorax sp. NPDC077693]|uniref:helix-turn-helix transcriptional regulator n=1 Tax=unclassified Acidovorax TaxID=2684926 RepID=UPI0037C714F9